MVFRYPLILIIICASFIIDSVCLEYGFNIILNLVCCPERRSVYVGLVVCRINNSITGIGIFR